jgi:hypothetical protein
LAGETCRQAEGAGTEQLVVLKSKMWAVCINPGSLEVTATPQGAGALRLSAGQEGLGAVRDLRQTEREASWKLGGKGLAASVRLNENALLVHFAAGEPGRLTWPLMDDQAAVRAFILPLFEGSYVPSDDAAWRAFLASRGPVSTTEGLSMPFWGLDCGGLTLTYLVTNPLNNALEFEDCRGHLGLRLTHEFTSNCHKKECGLIITLAGGSPVEPARQYRQWLVQQGQFVSLREKMAKVPDARKLLGAAHIYLWGDALISRHDVLDWKGLATKLVEQGAKPEPSPGKRIWEMMEPQIRAAAAEIVSSGVASGYARRQLAEELSNVLGRRDFYDGVSWRGVELPPEAQDLLARRTPNLDEPQLCRLNSLLFEAAFPKALTKSELWGDGVSVKMMDMFAAVGFDRLWLGLNSWQGAFRHPQAVKRAKDLGYLIATYDSYASIHRPGEPNTWETAQFDPPLYEEGAVVGPDGAKVRGFQGKGYRLSPIAARPYVEKRVKGLMSALPEPLNSWFVDCDAFGDLCDDYSPLHPATEQDDMDARLARMAWIRDSYGLVVGSEGGVAYAAPVIHFAHGMMTPVIGWGDTDLHKDKASRYYLGAYWPPDGPAIFMKQVPLKEAYRPIYFDPRFRLPLYETVFHDSVVATHQWGFGSLKFSDEAETVELLELLYNVPPLYHMNLEEFGKRKAPLKAHYAFFSPLHRELALSPLTDFEWLTPDRMVQRTVFGDEAEIIANFARQGFDYRGVLIPGRSVLSRRLRSGATTVFTPGSHSD